MQQPTDKMEKKHASEGWWRSYSKLEPPADLLITKTADLLQDLQRLYADRSIFNNLRNLLSLGG
jgi:hypothetical protein